MQSLGFESKNPTIFNMIADLESEGREIDFEEFLDAITSKLGDKESRVSECFILEWYQQDF
jgi:Ca2+-binding EF-hand superfamily protein